MFILACNGLNSKTANKIWGGSATSAMPGFDVALAYDRNWLKAFSKCVGLLVHMDESTACECFATFSFEFLHRIVTEMIRFLASTLQQKTSDCMNKAIVILWGSSKTKLSKLLDN